MIDMNYTESRKAQLLAFIRKLDLDLTGLTIYTEAASGHYANAPILTALAGAKKVYAQTEDSPYSSANDVIKHTNELAQRLAVEDRISVFEGRNHEALASADIITNSGFVRPFNLDLLCVVKSSAVIPLMWETWEIRESDFDLSYCKHKDILVMGTNEQHPMCNMGNYIGWLSLKLLFELGFDGGGVLVIGNTSIPAEPIVQCLKNSGINVCWASKDTTADVSYTQLNQHFLQHGQHYSHVIFAEHEHDDKFLSENGLLTIDMVKKVNPSLKIGVICGNVDAEALNMSGIKFAPAAIKPFGFISYQPYLMGERPVLTLFSAGLKVAESMARAKLSGKTNKEAAKYALQHSPAMDFNGELAWI